MPFDGRCLLFVVRWPLFIDCCLVYVGFCLLVGVCCSLSVACVVWYLLVRVCCSIRVFCRPFVVFMFVVCCMLFVVCCLLSFVHCLESGVCRSLAFVIDVCLLSVVP